MKANRSPSFQNHNQGNQGHSSHSPPPSRKYYSRDEVSLILRSTVEQKLSKIYKQLEQKQRIIKHLNEKLNRNDQALQNFTDLTAELAQNQNNFQQINLNSVNNILNEKLYNYWNTVQNTLQNIRNNSRDTIKLFQQKQQQKIQRTLGQIRHQYEEDVENFKKKNNAYWGKVKDTLGKLHNKLSGCQQKIGNIGKQFAKYQQQRTLNKQMVSDIQSGVNTVKILVELKKSVSNVYNNFEQVLRLEEVIKQNITNNQKTQLDIGDKVCSKCCEQINPAYNPQKMQIRQGNYNNKMKKNSEQFIILEYSIQDQESQQPVYRNQRGNPYQMGNTEPMRRQSYSLNKAPSSSSKLQHPPTSSKKRYQSYQNQEYNRHHYFGEQGKVFSPVSNKNAYFQSQQKLNISRKNKKDHYDDQSYDSFNFTQNNNTQLGSSTGVYPQTNVTQTGTSFMNFSLESKKQTLQSIKHRLRELIETKNLNKPIKVYIDHINYLKNEEGNYIFDLRGNMFKVMPQDFRELEGEGLIANIIKVDSYRNKESAINIKKI